MRTEFAAGARNAVRKCLNIGAQDRVVIIRDRARTEIAEAIEEEVESTGASVRAWTMEDVVERPATSFPRTLADEIVRFRPTASFFIGTGQRGELAFRQPMLHLLAEQLRCRHGHMIGINDVVKGGRMASVETPDAQLAGEVRAYMSQHPNSNRVGEFAVGTNVGLSRIIGNFLQDEKFPGVHIAFGDPYGFETNADWEAPSHVDALASHATVEIDGRRIMENGRFLV